jgi:iron only hydrogenase large subunit-like protein
MALTEHIIVPKVLHALAQEKILCLQTAPAVSISVAECLGEPVGTIWTGKIISAARLIGFKYDYDTNYGADLTIVEECTKLIQRLKTIQNHPIFTSCYSVWANFVLLEHPELINILRSAESPHMMVETVAKTYYAEKRRLIHQICMVLL